MERTTLAIYVLSGYVAEPSILYLESCARQRHWPARDRADLERLVEDLFIASETDVVSAITDHDNPLDESVLATAWKYVHEWNVVRPVREVNVTLGVAQPTRLLLDNAEKQRAGIPDRMRPASRGVCGDRRGKKWAALLRRRWGGRYASVPVMEHVDAAELDAKVTHIRAHF